MQHSKWFPLPPSSRSSFKLIVPGTGWTQAGDQFDQWRLSQPQLDNLLALASSWSRDFIKRNGSKGEGARSSSVTPSLVEKVTTGSSNPLLSSLGGNWASHPTLRALPTETTGCYENYTLHVLFLITFWRWDLPCCIVCSDVNHDILLMRQLHLPVQDNQCRQEKLRRQENWDEDCKRHWD